MPDSSLGPERLAATIDHTLLKPEADADAVDRLCDEAAVYRFASVCVNGRWVRRAAARLAGSSVVVCAVAGFPLGAMAPQVKAAEAARACDDGADEVDFVAALPDLMVGDRAALVREWSAVAEAARAVNREARLKVILETAALMAGVTGSVAERRIAMACDAARAAGIDFVKTSTGFHAAGGATEQAVRWMRRHGVGLGVKASGGIRDADGARAMLAAGADRLGCSAGVAIVTGQAGAAGY